MLLVDEVMPKTMGTLMIEQEKAPTKRCFVIGPIGDDNTPIRDHADWLFLGIIIPVFREQFPDFQVERADKIVRPGMIDSQMIIRLFDAELVIADMSFQNANAFYEMGIRHVAEKPIIHMYKEGETIPFDVKPHRAIKFSIQHPDLVKDAQHALRDAVAEAISPDFQVENPVTRARGVVELGKHATPAQEVLIGQMREMQDRMDGLERLVANLMTPLPPSVRGAPGGGLLSSVFDSQPSPSVLAYVAGLGAMRDPASPTLEALRRQNIEKFREKYESASDTTKDDETKRG